MSVAAPEAPREAAALAEKPKKAAEAAVEKTVGKEQKHTADAVSKQVPDMHGPGSSVAEVKSQSNRILSYAALPKIPSLSTVGKAAATAMAIASPPTALAVGVPAYAGVKLWGKAKEYPPFSWIDRCTRAVGSTAMEGGRSLWKLGSFPFRLGGTLARNTAALGVNVVGGGVRKTVDFFHDLLVDSEGESKHLLEKGIGALMSVPGKLYHLGETIVKSGIDVAAFSLKHPVRATIGGALLYTAITNPTLFLAKGGELVDAVINALSSFGGGATPPV